VQHKDAHSLANPVTRQALRAHAKPCATPVLTRLEPLAHCRDKASCHDQVHVWFQRARCRNLSNTDTSLL
jgi:hypothetical protein